MTTQNFQYKSFTFSSSILTLQAIKTWKTSHSSSNHRDNFFVTVQYNDAIGKGQAGLPPKKPKCYLADVNDCFSFIKSLEKKLQTQQIIIDNNILDIQNYFLLFKNDQVNKKQFYYLLSAIHSFKQPQFRAAISAVQFALFDLWSKLLNKPLLQCIYGQLTNLNFRSFVSVSISETQVQDAKESTKLTPFIKLKFSDDFENISKTLTNLIEGNIGQYIVLDANASWSSETTKKVITFIAQKQYQNKIYCLEQPYPVQPDVKQWTEVYQLSKQKNISIMADETFTNADNIQVVKQISNGVNIKIQKTGGLINAIKSALKSKQSNLYVWLGIMVSSWLGCTQTYMLAPLASFGDIDGGFIMKSPFQAGFIFQSSGQLTQTKCIGLGVENYEQKI